MTAAMIGLAGAGAAAQGEETAHPVPYFPAASDSTLQGFVRVINHSADAGVVLVDAYDDTGRHFGPLTLSLNGGETSHFNSDDLEAGNADKSLPAGTGPGHGDWRLALTSDLDIEVLSYIRTTDGFLSAMHDVAPIVGGYHWIATFNPGRNHNQVSLLRLVNTSDERAEVWVTGIDDAGASPGHGVTLSIPASASRTITASELESGVAPGLSGALGNGQGKWQLIVESDRELAVMSLLSNPTGHVTNLSSVPDDPGESYVVGLFPAAANPNGWQGFVRVINSSEQAGEVTIQPADDSDWAYDPLTLAIGAKATAHFNSDDLELGNAAKGLSGGIGPGKGHWCLEISSDLDIRVLAYIRTEDGFVTGMHDKAPDADGSHRVATFNPGSNRNQRSFVRLVNMGAEDAIVEISGLDGAGKSPGRAVRLSVGSGTATSLSAMALEAGDASMEGALGDGTGKWQLSVKSEQPLIVMSLLSNPTGHLTNLSTTPRGPSAGTRSSNLVTEMPAVSDANPNPGDRLTLSATVRNVGVFTSEATTLRYYRSDNAKISSADTLVGTDAVDQLAPATETFVATGLNAPSESRPHYYGACVDAVPGESDTRDNCSESVRVDIADSGLPDLRVRAPTVSDSSPEAGKAFTLYATVRNAGDGYARSTTLRYYRSTDSTITVGDTQVGVDAVGELPAGETSAESISLTAPVVAGTVYYGACVDAVPAESDTEDNCSTAVQIKVEDPDSTPLPDLEPSTPTVSNTTPGPGATFTLSTTVRNAGESASLTTTLRYYRSADATAGSDWSEVGSEAVASLPAGGVSAKSITLSAPVAPGTFYYSACVDPVADESNTTNNCSASVRIDVDAPPVPDLQVGTPSVSDSNPSPGATFTLSATVTNAGTAAASATTVRYYRSTDATITPSDALEGSGAVPALSAGDDSTGSISVTAPSTSGTVYYGACAVAVADEYAANNCSTSVSVDVQAPDAPDLTVSAPTSSDTAPQTGGSITLSATVANAGNAEAAATTLRFHRSADTAITTDDEQVGTADIRALAAGADSAGSVSAQVPDAAGTAYYGVCVDSVASETDTADNCSGALRVDIQPKRPDLTVGTPTASDTAPVAADSITLSATVANDGEAAAAATTLRFYRSADPTIATDDAQVGTTAIGALTVGTASDGSVSVQVPDAAGTVYYGACVDAVAGEADTADNCSTAVQVDVQAADAPDAPDLAAGVPTASDAAPVAGDSITLSATVANEGEAGAAATTLRFYSSLDATIATGDAQVGTTDISALGAGADSSGSITVQVPDTAGTVYYGVCVDAVADESHTANNCSATLQVDVQAPSAPDLAVGNPTASDTAPETGASISLSATVANGGNANAAATTLRFFSSADATIATGDAQVGTADVGTLAPGTNSSGSIAVAVPDAAGTVYYGACVDAVAGESDTADNCSAAVQVDVQAADAPDAPDLAVSTPTASDGTPEAGASITLSSTVTNDGDADAPATTLRFYSSADATIDSDDTQVGTVGIDALAADADGSGAVSVQAPDAPGTVYYGVCVDAVAGESHTANNCSAAVHVDVQAPPAPDLAVGAPTASDTAPEVGTSINLSATVTNAGDDDAAATTLRFYRSQDATITTTDAEVDTASVGKLSAGTNDPATISVQVPDTAGTVYYGACVDAVAGESDTANNCSAAVSVDVQPQRPDLAVGASVDDASPQAETAITISATVTNAGTADAAATTLTYYRSADDTISAADTALDTDAVSVLAPSGTSQQSASVTVPSATGIVYYGACVGAVASESATANNCSAAVSVDVQPKRPDLTVGTPTASDAAPEAGTSITLSATVANDGQADAAATTLRFYRSADATITADDAQVDTTDIGILGAGTDSSGSINVEVPDAAGTVYYGACVDAVADESDTANNCSAAVTVDVQPKRPNLAVGASVDEASPQAETAINLSATVTNAGAAEAAATTLTYYRSADDTISAADTALGTAAVGALTPAGTSQQSTSVTVPSATGTVYYGACVAAVADESDTADNCSAAVAVDVQPKRPDLAVVASVDDASPQVETSITLSATVTNAGAADAVATTLTYYRSADDTISAADTALGTAAVGALTPAGTSQQSTSVTVPSATGTVYYGACVAAVADESDTADNCSAAVAVDVQPKRPDLTVGTPTASEGAPEAGTSITLSATVANDGEADALATTLRFYKSADTTVSIDDTQVGTANFPALAAGVNGSGSVSVQLPDAAGTVHYGACVDAVAGESDTANNCSAAVSVDVQPKRPNLAVDASVDDESPQAGTSITLSATVANAGTASAATTTLTYYRSADDTISATDTSLGTDAVGILASSGTSHQSISVTVPSATGIVYYGACVGAVADESDTADNCSEAVSVDVQARAPDLAVDTPMASDTAPTAGTSITLSATVANDGAVDAPATTLRFYSSTDATISDDDAQVGTVAIGALTAGADSNESISVQVPDTAGTVYYGVCVDAVADESATADNCSAAVSVDVQPKQPDLTVGTPTTPEGTSPEASARITLSATVTNAGNADAAATLVTFYRSADNTISTADTAITAVNLEVLAPSASADPFTAVNVPSSAGTVYYGVCVDPVADESDTTNNCSAALQVDVQEPEGQPDLVLGPPTVSNDSPRTGALFTLHVTVTNDGDAPAAATTLRYYQSTDATITTNDVKLAHEPTDAMSAGQSWNRSTLASAPAQVGTFYYGACIDAVPYESDTSNNCSEAVEVDVQPVPDLAVDAPTASDTSPEAGTSITLSATVTNEGSAEAAATTLRFYSSTDDTITSADAGVGTADVGALAADADSSGSVSVQVPDAAGTVYYGACVDAVAGEYDTVNNCSVAVQVDVQAP
ncbi:MAG: hypothetical protein OXH15_06790 [Gammaproteobacteria bacterium]|nr:hypothetical protein [Gammaproteobacteria bacterium]